MVPAFGFNYLARMGGLVQLHSTRLPSTLHWRGGGGFAWLETTLRIQNRNDVLQALVVLAQQSAQFALKLNFPLKAFVAFHYLQRCQLLGKMAFELTEFSEF